MADNIEYEFYHLTKLTADSTYFFRVTAKNFLGWGDVSPSSVAVKTHATGKGEGRGERGEEGVSEGKGGETE